MTLTPAEQTVDVKLDLIMGPDIWPTMKVFQVGERKGHKNVNNGFPCDLSWARNVTLLLSVGYKLLVREEGIKTSIMALPCDLSWAGNVTLLLSVGHKLYINGDKGGG